MLVIVYKEHLEKSSKYNKKNENLVKWCNRKVRGKCDILNTNDIPGVTWNVGVCLVLTRGRVCQNGF